uniref:Uncharacterized protein n=1 Tax=Rhizophora mucronata TaxID=61149 RepID=A0A2P2P5Q9_RHIMU
MQLKSASNNIYGTGSNGSQHFFDSNQSSDLHKFPESTF